MVVGRLGTTFSSVSVVRDMLGSLFEVCGRLWVVSGSMDALPFEFLKGFSLTVRFFAIMLFVCGVWYMEGVEC